MGGDKNLLGERIAKVAKDLNLAMITDKRHVGSLKSIVEAARNNVGKNLETCMAVRLDDGGAVLLAIPKQLKFGNDVKQKLKKLAGELSKDFAAECWLGSADSLVYSKMRETADDLNLVLYTDMRHKGDLKTIVESANNDAAKGKLKVCMAVRLDDGHVAIMAGLAERTFSDDIKKKLKKLAEQLSKMYEVECWVLDE